MSSIVRLELGRTRRPSLRSLVATDLVLGLHSRELSSLAQQGVTLGAACLVRGLSRRCGGSGGSSGCTRSSGCSRSGGGGLSGAVRAGHAHGGGGG